MNDSDQMRCTAFHGSTQVATGELKRVALAAKRWLQSGGHEPILIFNDVTSEVIEIDFHGDEEEVLKRVESQIPQPTSEQTPRGPGRPKLGVVAREITLLPRHWEWLGTQPGGASVAIRKLVEAARRANGGKEQIRRAQDATYRFMSALAGDFNNFEEATRALYASDKDRFNNLIES